MSTSPPFTSAAEAGLRCHCCGAEALQGIAGSVAFQRVTSDCKPWPAGGLLAHCAACGLVQTAITPRWETEVREIYAGYTIYHQGGGEEQSVFAGQGTNGSLRSDVILERLRAHCALPARGRWLDIGCGNGSFLRACSRGFPDWFLWGTEVDEKYRAEVEAIAGVERMFAGDVKKVPGKFDVITLIHVLEHIPSPWRFLQTVREKLVPGGLLFIEVPDCLRNPFAMMVADHSAHFSPAMLAEMVAAAGFELLFAASDWVPREVSVVARNAGALPRRLLPQLEARRVIEGADWLIQVKDAVQPLVARPNFGLFGTAIAATWMDAETNRAANFFVDEDTARVGRRHLGRPIVAPADVSDGADIFIALPFPLAQTIAARLRRRGVGVYVPVSQV